MESYQKAQLARTIAKVRGSVIKSKALSLEELVSLPTEDTKEFNLGVLNVRCVGQDREDVVADPIVLSKPVTYKKTTLGSGEIVYNFYDTLNDSLCYVFSETKYGLEWLLLYRD